MTPGELVQTVAKVLGIPEATIVVHDRNLVVAGLRSKYGRGRGAAKVTVRDAAHLLTAILGSEQVKDSVDAVERYSETQPQRSLSSKKLYADIGIKELAALPPDHSFVDALETLIQCAAGGSLQLATEATGTRGRKIDAAPMIEVVAVTPGTVGNIRISGVKSRLTADVRYAIPGPWDKPGSKNPSKKEVDEWEARIKSHGEDTGFSASRRMNEKIIVGVAEAFAQEQETK